MDGQGPEWTQYLGGIVDGSAEVLLEIMFALSWSMNIIESPILFPPSRLVFTPLVFVRYHFRTFTTLSPVSATTSTFPRLGLRRHTDSGKLTPPGRSIDKAKRA
jgi:hypothetical protein